jgi:N-acetylmuramoyl-L-alanine amidase
MFSNITDGSLVAGNENKRQNYWRYYMFKKLVISTVSILTMSIYILNPMTNAEASTTYQVQSGDTLWKIATKYGVPIAQLKSVNNRTSDVIYPGQNLVIPNATISEADKDLMARLVYAEAKGEPYAGKVAVATVILNRVASSEFPNSIREVIYQVSNGYYAFTPVQNGAINQPADAASRNAVNEALAFRGQGSGSLFFYNPNTAVSQWITFRPVTITIGNHRFAR